METYFNLYKKAKELYDKGNVFIEKVKSDEQKNLYVFQANNHTVTLKLERKGGGNTPWIRDWKCDCKSFSIYQNVECYHKLACELFLMMK